jgi:hypothetical protein
MSWAKPDGDVIQSAPFIDGADWELTKNAHLLMEIASRWGAESLGNVCGFFHVPRDWRCPCCCRNKSEIARLDKNGNLLCAIVRHHDHLEDNVRRVLRSSAEQRDRGSLEARVISLVRFPPTLICNDCNVLDSAAKSIVGAPSYFSFAPYEIAAFVAPVANSPHDVAAINTEQLQYAFRYAQPVLLLLLERLKSLVTPQCGWGRHA